MSIKELIIFGVLEKSRDTLKLYVWVCITDFFSSKTAGACFKQVFSYMDFIQHGLKIALK